MDKLLQASPHQGLQVQNLSGQWIDVPPIHGSLVINIGKGGMIPFSAQCHFWYSLTKLLSLSPAVSLEPHLTEFYHQKARLQDTRSHSSRISLCRFDWQTRYLIVRHCDYLIKEDDVATVPPEILKLRDERGTIVPTDCMLRSCLNSYGTKLLTFPSSHKFFWIWQRAFG